MSERETQGALNEKQLRQWLTTTVRLSAVTQPDQVRLHIANSHHRDPEATTFLNFSCRGVKGFLSEKLERWRYDAVTIPAQRKTISFVSVPITYYSVTYFNHAFVLHECA